MRTRVAISRSETVGRGIAEALELLGDIAPLLRGKHVAVKPNDTWASAEDRTACTQADSVEAVIRYVKLFDPARITVTGGAGAAETDEVFRVMGIDKVIEREKVGFFDHNRGPFVSVALEFGPQNEVMVNPRVLEYDTLISLAQHKVHDTATVSLTMKNIALSFPAADYYGHPRLRQKKPHRIFEDVHGFIAGMCLRFPIGIGIIVGHPAMLERGPIGGRTFDTGLTIAGTDCVAVDAVGAHLLGVGHVDHILLAQRLGLGNADPGAIEIAGIGLDEAKTIFDRKAGKVHAFAGG